MNFKTPPRATNESYNTPGYSWFSRTTPPLRRSGRRSLTFEGSASAATTTTSVRGPPISHRQRGDRFVVFSLECFSWVGSPHRSRIPKQSFAPIRPQNCSRWRGIQCPNSHQLTYRCDQAPEIFARILRYFLSSMTLPPNELFLGEGAKRTRTLRSKL